MTDPIVIIDAGTLTFSEEDLTATGLLVPYGVKARSNLGEFTVAAGVFDIPEDLTGAGLNIEHEREQVVGGVTKAWEQSEGILGTFAFARTAEGRKAFADAKSGERKHLSAEVARVKVAGGKAIGGRLFGAALVKSPAFAGATLLAAEDTPGAVATPAASGAITEPEHLEVEAETLPVDITVTTPAGDSAVYEPTAAPAEGTPTQEGSTLTANAPAAGAPAPAPVPATLLAGAPGAPAATTTPRPVELGTLFAAFQRVRSHTGSAEDETLLAALTDIKISGSGALPASGVLRENWLGELYNGIPYEREYITLGTLGTAITAAGKKGFRVKRGTSGSPIAGPDGIPNGGTWAGNKAEINSYAGHSSTIASTLLRFAVGDDIGREFYDLPGGEESVEAFLKLLLEDHLYWSDTNALGAWVTAAGTPVAPATALYSTAYPDSVGMVIQGILAVKAKKADGRRDVPTFGILNEVAYQDVAYAAGGPENLPAFVSLVLSTNSEGLADGNVQLVQGDTGIDDTASVIIGAKRAIEFDELPGGPLKVDALDLAKGGIDKAVHGYLQTFVVRPEAVVLVGVADV